MQYIMHERGVTMRESTRSQYANRDIYESEAFTQKVNIRNQMIFRDWIGGMTGGQLAKKYYLAEITVRGCLTKMKRLYERIQVNDV